MKRRKFLTTAVSVSGFSFLGMHALVSPDDSGRKGNVLAGGPLIKSLKLQTACPPAELKKFYAETIGLRIASESKNEITVMGGETPISFEFINQNGYRPFYHFAFNIPENKIQKAFEWQRKRTPVAGLFPDAPKDAITSFVNWNAHSIFFIDPAGNLVEYIARHDLKNAADGDFSTNDILYASEIALITDDIENDGKKILQNLDLTEYRPAVPGFWPIGSELGLLIMIEKGRLWSGNPGQENKTDIFETTVTLNKKIKDKNLILTNRPYSINGI